MESATSTTTRDILGLALLAALFEKPASRAAAVDAARGLCLPWLTPTREVLVLLLSEYCEAGYLHARHHLARDAGRPGNALLEVTPEGESELRCLVLHRTAQPAHHLVILCESLRLSVAERLDPPAREEVLRGHIHARRRCLAMQHRRLVTAGTESATLAHTLRYQIACARAEFAVLAGASRTDAGANPVLARMHRHPVVRAQAELDALVADAHEDEGDAIPFLPFST